MRKLFFPLIAVALLFAMASCTKCKTCDMTVTITGAGDPVESKLTKEFCDDDLKAVDGETVTSEAGGMKTVTVYDCKK